MAKTPQQNFIFKKHMSIGEADAENDKQFLNECFIDYGDYELLSRTNVPQSILLGRTGVGKSALIEELEKNEERVIRIEPEQLSLKYVSNSTIIKFFENLGINLDVFYSLLWQHTLAVELIKYHYQIDSHDAKKSFLTTITNLISRDQKKQQAIEYIDEWGDKFWIDTDKRIIEITEKLESSLKATIKANMGISNFQLEGMQKLSEEEKSEIVQHAKKVVHTVQIEKLAKVISLLAEDIFTDNQKKTYILIDKLDENWVEDELRYKLVRALIETIKKFKKIENVKIIITLRVDLLNRVLDKTRDSGFQREKYESLFLRIEWKKEQLKELLNKRINFLLKNKYTNSEVNFDDIFPSKIEKASASDYILDRTLLRPRDAILFVNNCLMQAEGRIEITGSMIKAAEKTYSEDRIESLQYEWFVEHPSLKKYIGILQNRPTSFKVSNITKEDLDMLVLDLGDCSIEEGDIVFKSVHKYMASSYPEDVRYLTETRQNILFILYKIGVIGIKTDGISSARWSNNRTLDLTPTKIELTSIVYIHKMLWRALGINTQG